MIRDSEVRKVVINPVTTRRCQKFPDRTETLSERMTVLSGIGSVVRSFGPGADRIQDSSQEFGPKGRQPIIVPLELTTAVAQRNRMVARFSSVRHLHADVGRFRAATRRGRRLRSIDVITVPHSQPSQGESWLSQTCWRSAAKCIGPAHAAAPRRCTNGSDLSGTAA